MAIRQIDLNLYRVFSALMQHRSVTEAARELGITTSAASHALARLREALDDELFIRRDTGMEPTRLALELSPNITDGLSRMAAAVSSAQFVPARTARTFHVAAGDYAATVLLPALVGRMTRSAPKVNLRVFPCNRLDVIGYLDEGRIDVAFGWFDSLPDRIRRTTILQEYEALVVRAGHPLLQGEVTIARLFEFHRIVVELTGSSEQTVDGFLNDRGVARRVWMDHLLVANKNETQSLVGKVAISVPYFAAVAPMLMETDMVAALPMRLALRVAKHGEVAVLDLPYPPVEVSLEAVWHHRADRDRGVRWLISELNEVVRRLA